MTIARYSFLPWLRRGISNQLQTPAGTASRAALDVTLTVASDVASEALPPRTVQLVGPGDIIGINPQLVVRTEPRNWVTDFEPNYLPFVEFYDEDLAWRYTPAAPDGAQHRLAPWISLLVLKEGEFTRDTTPGRPLQSVKLQGVTAAQIFPPDDQLWAWAHVHVNGSLGTAHTPDLAALDALISPDPDRAYCRLVSPRRLEPNTPYYAFVIPTFEVGRKAGLGIPVPDTDAGLALAWASATEFPIYYEWFFRTGAAGDFEELVRALKPRPIDERVGIRDLDIQRPGFTLPPITSPPDDIVGLEGALLSPSSKPRPLAPSSNFPPEIEAHVNLAAEAEESGVDDPIVTAPLYGRWHALVKRISADPATRKWVNELNVDPRYRAAAGFGTLVIQKNQEEYMKLAWQQIGEVLAANRKIHYSQVAIEASQHAFVKHLLPMPTEKALAVAAPTMRKVMGSPVTVHYLVEGSRLPRTALSGAFRKQLRPRGALVRRAFPEARAAGRAPLAEAVARLNEGTVSAAPPRALPEGPTLERLTDADARPLPEPLRVAMTNSLLLLLVALLVCLILLVAGPGLLTRVLAVLLAAGAVAGYRWLEAARRKRVAGSNLSPRNLTPEAVRDAPPNPSFELLPTGSSPETAPDVAAAPGPDSRDARDFRAALTGFHQLLELRAEPPAERAALALGQVHATVLRAIEPTRAFPRRLAPMLRVGGRPLGTHLRDTYADGAPAGPAPETDRVVPVMAYPDIKKPMYEPLRDISSELLVPNLSLIEPNTISLMVRNQAFIEAYMVGLNHEFARELLWREYPTDQRPSTFRQFWDVSNYVNVEGLDPKTLEERLRDIRRIHEWSVSSRLGEHDNRRKPGDPPETQGTPLAARPVVLVVRGDLLKRYPNTIIYAQRARWGQAADNTTRLVLWDETGERSENDPADPNIRFPLYKASVGPDIHFVGFDLSVGEVQGDPTLAETAAAKASIPANRLGWFFVLKEVVGEPRLGLDEHPPAAPGTVKWDNLSWDHLGVGTGLIDVAKPFASDPPGSSGGVTWGANAADMAFILYQKPVLVAVHAREMLRGVA
jgi:hypothetical protein